LVESLVRDNESTFGAHGTDKDFEKERGNIIEFPVCMTLGGKSKYSIEHMLPVEHPTGTIHRTNLILKKVSPGCGL